MNVTTTSVPGRTRRPRKPRAWRLATVAATAATAASLLGLAVGPAMADTTLTNGPTIQIGQFTPTLGYGSTSILPGNNGVLGALTQIFLRSNTPQTDQSLTADFNNVAGEGSVSTSDLNAPDFQYWTFQRVGYVGLSTPASAELISMGAPSTLLQAVPVYQIISQVETSNTTNCLTAMATAAGSTVASESCSSNSPSQMWVVGATSEDNQFIDGSTGQFYTLPFGHTAQSIQNAIMVATGPAGEANWEQWFSTALQPGGTPSPEAVIENVAALAADGWNTNTAPVLAATGNLAGVNSGVTLEAQDWPTIGADATWLLAAVNLSSPTTYSQTYGSTSTASAQCSLLGCLVGG